MSYDLEIGEEDIGYTYNVAPMWYSCYPNKGIRVVYGLSGEEAIPVLRKLREYMEDNKDKLMKLQPDNGWGSYEGAVKFVSKLIMMSLRNKDAIWHGD